MNKLKRTALVAAISSVSVSGGVVAAELLDDDSLEMVTGQAGLTIDIETQVEIGEFAYQDEGFIIFQGMRIGGNSMGNGTGTGGELLDNLRMEIDVASPGESFSYGFSQVRDIAQMYVDESNADPEFAAAAGGTDPNRGLAIDSERTYNDGDLVIHFDFTDGWANEGGLNDYLNAGRFASDNYDDVERMLEHAVDFRIEIDGIGLGASNYEIGSRGLDVDGNHSTGLHEGAAGTTTLMSQIGIQGYLGPEDLHISNNGNGFGADGSAIGGILGTGNADSKITISAYTIITDMDVYIDIAGVRINDLQIHNRRGDRSGLDGTSSFDFAHSIRQIYAVNEAVVSYDDLAAGGNGYVDGVALNARFKGDMDIGHISFGDERQSIGSIYMTDMESTTNWTVSAH